VKFFFQLSVYIKKIHPQKITVSGQVVQCRFKCLHDFFQAQCPLSNMCLWFTGLYTWQLVMV